MNDFWIHYKYIYCLPFPVLGYIFDLPPFSSFHLGHALCQNVYVRDAGLGDTTITTRFDELAFAIRKL